VELTAEFISFLLAGQSKILFFFLAVPSLSNPSGPPLVDPLQNNLLIALDLGFLLLDSLRFLLVLSTKFLEFNAFTLFKFLNEVA